jgi:hypothetical protein
MRTSVVVQVSLLSYLGFGCGGAAKPAETTEAPETPPADAQQQASTEPGAPEIPWANKTSDQKMEYMGLYVLPEMKKLFQGHDATAFSTFECQTCHGRDMEQVDFKLPNKLPPLPEPGTIEAAKAAQPELAAFMMNRVVPAMAKLLALEPRSAGNPKGFGCFDCHPTQ